MGTLGWIIVASVFVLAVVAVYVYDSLRPAYEAKSSLDAPDSDPEEYAGIVLIPKKLILVMWVMVAGLAALAYYQPTYEIPALLLCGLALIAASVRIHSKSKPTSRADVGLAFTNGLVTLTYVALFSGVYFVSDTGGVGQGWMIAFLLAGALTCYLFVGSRPSLLACVRFVLSVMLLGYFAFASPFHFVSFAVDREDAQAVVEAYDGAMVRHYGEDESQARLIRALVRDGGVEPDLSKPVAARASFLRERGALGNDEEILARELTRQGYFRGRDYEEMGALQFAWFLEEHRSWGSGVGTDEALERLHERRLPAAVRVKLADQVAEDALAAGAFIFLDRLVGWIEMLERLGYPQKGEESRARALEFLVAEDLYRLSYQFDGVRVMERFGVPAGFDIEELHETLELQARGPLFGTADVDEALAYMALASIERFPEWEPIAELRSALFSRLWRHRNAMTALLVAIASVAITLRTPKAADETLEPRAQVT